MALIWMTLLGFGAIERAFEVGQQLFQPNDALFFALNDGIAICKGPGLRLLRSKSDLPVVTQNRDLLHKIGVTGGSFQKRIGNAKLDPTFLMADVEIVKTYELYNINRVKLENLLHRIFEAARLDIEIKDRFGYPVTPRDWFLVPLFAINEAVKRIRDGNVIALRYDPKTALFVKMLFIQKSSINAVWGYSQNAFTFSDLFKGTNNLNVKTCGAPFILSNHPKNPGAIWVWRCLFVRCHVNASGETPPRLGVFVGVSGCNRKSDALSDAIVRQLAPHRRTAR